MNVVLLSSLPGSLGDAGGDLEALGGSAAHLEVLRRRGFLKAWGWHWGWASGVGGAGWRWPAVGGGGGRVPGDAGGRPEGLDDGGLAL